MSLPASSAALRGVLGVLPHPGPQFWGPAIGGSGKLVIGLQGALIWHSTRARTSLNAALPASHSGVHVSEIG